jgi:hypothetical protein
MLRTKLAAMVAAQTARHISPSYTIAETKANITNGVPASVTDQALIINALKLALDALLASANLDDLDAIFLIFTDNTQTTLKKAVLLSGTKPLAQTMKPKSYFVLASISRNYVGGGWVVHGTGPGARVMLSHKRSVVDKLTKKANAAINENEIAHMNDGESHLG